MSADENEQGEGPGRRNERVEMEHARTLEAVDPGESPLAHARLHRQLTVDEAARRASVSADEVQWLEEGRLYRFPTPDRALTVALLYATALGIDHREALDLAGLPAPPLPTSPKRRIIALAAFLAVIAAAILAVMLGQGGTTPKSPAAKTTSSS